MAKKKKKMTVMLAMMMLITAAVKTTTKIKRWLSSVYTMTQSQETTVTWKWMQSTMQNATFGLGLIDSRLASENNV